MSIVEKVKSGSCGTISRAVWYAWFQFTSKSGEHSLTRSATVLPRTISSSPVCQHLHVAADDVSAALALAADAETAEVSYSDSANFPNVSSPRNRVMIRGQNPHGKYDMMYNRTTDTAVLEIGRTRCGSDALLLGDNGADRNSSPAYE